MLFNLLVWGVFVYVAHLNASPAWSAPSLNEEVCQGYIVDSMSTAETGKVEPNAPFFLTFAMHTLNGKAVTVNSLQLWWSYALSDEVGPFFPLHMQGGLSQMGKPIRNNEKSLYHTFKPTVVSDTMKGMTLKGSLPPHKTLLGFLQGEFKIEGCASSFIAGATIGVSTEPDTFPFYDQWIGLRRPPFPLPSGISPTP